MNWKNIAAAFAVLVVSALAAAEPEVWYVHGWNALRAKKDSQENAVALLKDIFPSASISVKEWDSLKPFGKSIKRADVFAAALAKQIGELPEEKRKNLILVGHSLGGMIAIRTVAALSRQNIAIRQAIFLAAAIPADDMDCREVFRQRLTECINIFCPKDSVLKSAYGVAGERQYRNALGAIGYAVPSFHRQFCKRDGDKHDAVEYIVCLKKRMRSPSDPPVRLDIEVPYACKPLKAVSPELFKLLEPIGQYDGWRLYRRKYLKNYYMIFDPADQVRAFGTEKEMRKSFDAVKRQLKIRNIQIRM